MSLHDNMAHHYRANHHERGNEDLYSAESVLIQKSLHELNNGIAKDPMTKLRLLCLSRGANGIIEMGRAFRKMDDDGSMALNKDKFMRGINEMGLEVTDEEINEIFDRFDEYGSRTLDMTEFLVKLRPPLSQTRLNSIHMAFNKMDKDGTGVITLDDIKREYCVLDHPKYDSGELTKDELLTEFMHHFEGGRGYLNGKVTREEFENYYAAISATIDTDTYFDLMIRRAYHL